MAEAKRKRGESFESLIRRFNKKLQQSGKLLQSRKVKYFQRPKSRTKARADALRKMTIKSEKDYLKKIGKLKDEDVRVRR